jgi:hypothetical protein
MITLLITQYFLLALPPQLVPAQPVISEPSSLVDESLLCVQMDYPNVSELRVDYVENSPQALYLRSPGEEELPIAEPRDSGHHPKNRRGSGVIQCASSFARGH